MAHELMRERSGHACNQEAPADMLENAFVPHADEVGDVFGVRAGGLAGAKRHIADAARGFYDFFGGRRPLTSLPALVFLLEKCEETLLVKLRASDKMDGWYRVAHGRDAGGQYARVGRWVHVAAFTCATSLAKVSSCAWCERIVFVSFSNWRVLSRTATFVSRLSFQAGLQML